MMLKSSSDHALAEPAQEHDLKITSASLLQFVPPDLQFAE